MFEGFECRGEINVYGSENYDNLIAKRSELRFEHRRVWGHYIAKVRIDS
jgi:hypothetical protein